MVKDKSVDKIFGQINQLVAGRKFSVKNARFAAFVKSEGVFPPTSGSFDGLSVFALSPETYRHMGAEHKQKLKLLIGDKEDEEETLLDAENEMIHLPMARKEAIWMLKGIIFALKHMNKGNNTFTSLPYTKGFKFLNDDKKFDAIYEATCIFSFVRFLSWLNAIG